MVPGTHGIRPAGSWLSKHHRGCPPAGQEDPALADVCCCPSCRGHLRVGEERAICAQCGAGFTREDGIWQLYWPHDTAATDVTRKVKEFYEEHPFPNYEPDESLRTLIEKARRGIFARLLSEQQPYNSRILEVGCGTGQLSNFLGIGCRSVFGTDLCMKSLKLAEGFRSRQQQSRVRFLQMNLFRPALRSEQFDVILCNGVLHHTSDPRGGFESISRLVRPGGYLIVGLYNRYGRLLLDARRFLFRLTGGRARWVDPYIRTARLSRTREDTWFADQYKNPHESKHTMGESLAWCRGTGLDFVNAIPRFRPWEPFTELGKYVPSGNSHRIHLNRGAETIPSSLQRALQDGFHLRSHAILIAGMRSRHETVSQQNDPVGPRLLGLELLRVAETARVGGEGYPGSPGRSIDKSWKESHVHPWVRHGGKQVIQTVSQRRNCPGAQIVRGKLLHNGLIVQQLPGQQTAYEQQSQSRAGQQEVPLEGSGGLVVRFLVHRIHRKAGNQSDSTGVDMFPVQRSARSRWSPN